MNLIVQVYDGLPPGRRRVEVVERKGIGHPDTICDGLAEHICVRLCRYYLDHFGVILHHNVDKILLCGGSSRVSFGGGEILYPIEIYLGGRATEDYKGEPIPVHAIAVNSCREWLRLNLPALDADRDLRIFSRLRPGSSELTQLFDSHKHVPLANDTVCGAGFAPLSDLEKTVLEVERSLNSPETKQIHPAIGADIKVMGVRLDDRIELTIGCALVSRFVRDLDDYIQQKGMVKTLALEVARRATPMLAEATVNGADDLDKGNIFLTVTGTSAEAGDDGEVGRGNRACGLITPYRPMTMEAVVGKNPVTHVGKLYNLMAGRLAATLANEIEDAANVECVLVNQIGRPVSDPHLVDIRLSFANRIQDRQYREQVSGIVQSELAKMDELRHSLLAGRVQLY